MPVNHTRKVAMTAPIEPTPAEPTGATPPAPTAPTTPAEPAEPVLADLAKEREKRQRLESALAESLGVQLSQGGGNDSHYAQLTAKLAPLKQLADMLGGQPTGDGKTDIERLTERLTQHETELAKERAGRYRAEVAAEKGLTPAQAARLTGTTREELLADADALVALFPAAAPGTPRTPAPDPTQGARGPVDIDAQIRDAESKGDVKTAIRLKSQKFYAQNQK